MTRLTTVADPEAAAQRAAQEIARDLRDAVQRRGVAHLALAGGNTPRRAYELLAGLLDDWSAVELWYGDERCVGPEDPQSNHRLVADSMLAGIAARGPAVAERPPPARTPLRSRTGPGRRSAGAPHPGGARARRRRAGLRRGAAGAGRARRGRPRGRASGGSAAARRAPVARSRAARSRRGRTHGLAVPRPPRDAGRSGRCACRSTTPPSRRPSASRSACRCCAPRATACC